MTMHCMYDHSYLSVLERVSHLVPVRALPKSVDNRPTLTDNNGSVYRNQYKEQSTYMNIC